MFNLISRDEKFHHIGQTDISLCGERDLHSVERYSHIASLGTLLRASLRNDVCRFCLEIAAVELQKAHPTRELASPLLGFKTLSWHPGWATFTSPLHSTFVWPEDGHAEAICHLRDRFINGVPLDGHNPGRPGCVCGIYAATETKRAAPNYMTESGVLVIVEAQGEIDVWNRGFRSGAAQIRAVVNGVNPASLDGYKPDSRYVRDALRLNAPKAARYFGVQEIDWR